MAERPGKVAQHTKAHSSGRTVNDGVVQRKFAFLSGEIPEAEASREVSRRNSTAEVSVGSPEPVECASTPDPQQTAKTPYGRAERLEESGGKHGGTQTFGLTFFA
jgi:hypothetical protein